MSALIDQLVAEIVSLEVRLYSCHARVDGLTDEEALHDLRTTVRRLRSLLRPLRGLPGVEQVERAAVEVGRLTTPIRDREVLAAYLHRQGHHLAATRRTAQLSEDYWAVARSAELKQLFAVLDVFPRFLRASQHQGLLKKLHKRIDKRLEKQWQALEQALHDPLHDRHRLRLLIKRVRYAAEAYPQLNHLPKPALKSLKSAQEALGDWHDCWQWLVRAEQEPDLHACITGWRRTMSQAENRADRVLDQLSERCFAR